MSEKTLGRVAFDAFQEAKGMRPEDVEIIWPSGIAMASWEAAAQAVRRAVIEECAKVADDHAEAARRTESNANKTRDVQTASFFRAIKSEAISIAVMIRALAND